MSQSRLPSLSCQFIADYPIEKARPAAYNPRQLPPDRFDALVESIKTLGVIRPIIVTKSDLIIAGHQRTRAILHCGYKTTPAVVIPDVNLSDEIAFNMIHNAADVEHSDGSYTLPGGKPGDWSVVSGASIRQHSAPQSGVRRHEIMRLIQRFGDWGCVVADETGAVVGCQLYAGAAYILKRNLLVRYVTKEQGSIVREKFSQQYGKFSYDKLDYTPWVQTLAQPMRLRQKDDGSAPAQSVMYVERVTPLMDKEKDRLLDFGAGQMDHAKDLIRKGYRVFPVEFFHRSSGSMDIDKVTVRLRIDQMLQEIATRGLFEMSISDAVINSVASVEAEGDVLNCLAAFTKPGGMAFFSSRSREDYENMVNKQNKTRGMASVVNFFDDNGFTGINMKGVWLMQKFHSLAEMEALAIKFLGDSPRIAHHPGYWDCGVEVTRKHTRALEASILREFDLAWPNGDSVNRGKAAVDAWHQACKISGVALD